MDFTIKLYGVADEIVLRRTDEKLNLILILSKETEMNKTLADLLENVAESKTLAESLAVLMAGLRAQHAAAVTDLSEEQQAQVNQLFNDIDESQAIIIASMATNTVQTDASLPVEQPAE